MKSIQYLAGLLLAAFLFTSPVGAQSTQFEAVLSSSNEVPALTSTASGSITATLTGNVLSVSGSFADLEGAYDASIGAHIHAGMAGQNGQVLITLNPTVNADLRSGSFAELNNTFTLTAQQQAALEARGLYVNIHTQTHAGGELRGQLRPSVDASFRATLSSGAAVPSNTSQAQGALLAELSGNTLIVTGAFSNLESQLATDIAGGAHIHSGMAGQSGGVDFALTAQASADLKSAVFLAADNTFTLSAQQMAALEDQGLYVNVHSQNHAEGEIRGQFKSEAGVDFIAQLSGSNEGSSVTSQASGSISASLQGNILTVSGSFADLESDLATSVSGGAHIHFGMAGESGSVAFPLTIESGTDTRAGVMLADHNTFTLTANQMAALKARGAYVNIHSMSHTSGEIRGQFMAASSTSFTVLLSGDHETTTTDSQATGTLLVEVSGDKATVSGAYSLEGQLATEVAGGAHIHGETAGRSGPVLLALQATSQASGGLFVASENSFELTAEQSAMLQARSLYVNVHSSNHTAGEIRGQVAPTGSVQLDAVLTGHAENPGVDSDASGTVLVELTNSGQIVVTGGFDNLSSDFNTAVGGGAHIHAAGFGTNGDVSLALNTHLDADSRGGVFLASENTFEADAQLSSGLMQGGFYVNVHSMSHASGEVRGQIVAPDVLTFEADLQGSNETSIVASQGSGSVIAQLNGDQLTVSGSFSGLGSPLAVNVGGGAHLHAAAAGTSGGVMMALDVNADVSLQAGSFAASENTFTLTAEQKAALLSGGVYVNVHSVSNPDGELRGQLLVSANASPASAQITAPSATTTTTIDVTGSGSVTFDWTDAQDPNGNEVTYVWELAADANFQTMLMTERTGSESMIEVSFQTMTSLLSSLNVGLGSETTLYHRVTSSDGSDSQTSEPRAAPVSRGVATANETEKNLPQDFVLLGNYPNPFNPTTTIRFDLPQSAEVQVQVFDILGRRVLTTPTQAMSAGSRRSISINAAGLNSGVYLYRVTALTDGQPLVKTGQMTLLK